MPQPLPKAKNPQVQKMADQSPNYLSAYNVCLDCEWKFARKLTKLQNVRTLGYLMLNAPKDVSTGVRTELSRSIHSCKNNEEVADLGAFFELYFITPCELPVCYPHFLHSNPPSEHFFSLQVQRADPSNQRSSVESLL